MVVDCGGGTADVISYSVTKADPMLVKECVKGEGSTSTPIELESSH